MKHRIFRLTASAVEHKLTWDTAIEYGEIETVAEFDNYEDAVNAYDCGNYDSELYGVE